MRLRVLLWEKTWYGAEIRKGKKLTPVNPNNDSLETNHWRLQLKTPSGDPVDWLRIELK